MSLWRDAIPKCPSAVRPCGVAHPDCATPPVPHSGREPKMSFCFRDNFSLHISSETQGASAPSSPWLLLLSLRRTPNSRWNSERPPTAVLRARCPETRCSNPALPFPSCETTRRRVFWGLSLLDYKMGMKQHYAAMESQVKLGRLGPLSGTQEALR